MKKRILFCLAALGTASMLFGFDSAETADGLLEKMQAASKDAAGAVMDMGMNVNVGVNIRDGTTTSTLNVAMSGDFDMAMNMDPLAMSMDGSMTVSGLGQNETIAMKMYGVTDENQQFNTYVYTEDSTSGESGWEYESSDMSGLDMASLMEASANIDYSEWGMNFELAPEAVDVNGTECYLLSTVIDSESFNTMITKSAEMTGQDLTSDENVQMVLSMLGGLKMKLEYYVDAATYLPVKFHMDLNDSDMSAINQYAAMAMGQMAEGSSVEIALNDVSVDATMAYGEANDITVPEEALAAVESGEASSLEELVENTDVSAEVATEATTEAVTEAVSE